MCNTFTTSGYMPEAFEETFMMLFPKAPEFYLNNGIPQGSVLETTLYSL